MKISMLPLESQDTEKMHDGHHSVKVPNIEDIALMRPYFFEFFQLAHFDVNLPDLVSNALEAGISKLESSMHPLMHISKEGHDNIGAVFFLTGLTDADFESSTNIKDLIRGVAVRISYGPDSSKNPRWSFLDIGRYHISAYGFRRFLPRESELENKLQKNECLSNEVHISLRWIKKDGIWRFHDPYDGSIFHKGRTPWIRTLKVRDISSGLDKKSNLIPEQDGLDDYAQPSICVGENVLDRMKAKKTSHSSYEAVQGLLSNFGDVQLQEEVSSLSPEEGNDYLFQRIVPAIIRFTQS